MMKTDDPFVSIFTRERLSLLLPPDTADRFFEALLGDPHEGAYDMELCYCGGNLDKLLFEIRLRQRPGKCLACHLTYGLPQVFEKHPAIDLKRVTEKVKELIEGQASIRSWKLGPTREISRELHAIPLVITLEGQKS